MMRRLPFASLLLAAALAAAAGAWRGPQAQGVPTDTLRGSGIDAQDWFGSATALRGDWLVVGAPRSLLAVGGPSFPAGRAYAFRREGGEWVETQILRPTPPPATGDTDFGSALGLSHDGSLLVVGAPYERTPAHAQVGAGYVYRFDGAAGQWVPDGKLVTTATTAFVHTGRAVAVAGTAEGVVGSPGALAAMHGGPDGRSAAVYRRAAGGGAWALEAVVHPGTPDGFVDVISGQQLALAAHPAEGERLAAGAALEDTPDGTGAVYVYRNDGPTGGPAVWVLERRFAPTEAGAGRAFGTSVALSADGRLLLVGADDFANSSIGPGRAYVYRREGSGASSVWVEEAVIPSPSGVGTVGFGWGAALTEAGGSAVAGVGQGGHLWMYRRAESGVWSLLGVAERPMAGNSVALDGRRGSAGNPFDGEEGENAGVAYVFDLTSVVTAGEAGPEAPSGLGVSVAPNPVGVVASLTLTLPASGAVRVGVYDALGREVAVAFEGVLGAGPHRLPLNVSSLAPGAYVVRVRTEAGAATARLAVVR